MQPKAFVSLMNRAMQNTFAYRTSYIITLLTYFISILSLYALWTAIFDGQDELAGMTWDQMKAYLMITFITNSLLSWYSETRISGKILDGSVSVDLLKPLDFQKARLAETLGASAVEGGLGLLFIAIISAFVSDVVTPQTLLSWLLFVLGLAGSLAVKFGIVYLAGLLCFWSTGSLGIVWARIAITNLLSGALIPLAFFPEWLKQITLVLPFQGIVHTPATLFLDQAGTSEAIQLIAVQWGWAVALWWAGKGLWHWAVRKITIHGG
ncbi:MAG: ABC-2 family transporter protein [Cohnella sp.]|nr:ABC-2 family transporter protein [Cohnella sp.]